AALLNLVHQERAWREDQKSTGAPMLCSARAASGCQLDLVPGEDTVVPGSTSESTSFGRRERRAASLLLGWRPTAAFDLYAEGHYAELLTKQDTRQVNAGPNFAAGSSFDPASGCQLDLVPGEDTVVPGSTSESTSFGRRERRAASLLLGWRPTAAFDLYAEGHYAELLTKQDTRQVNAGPNFAAGSSFDPAS